jgi:hypothetical protein
MVAQWQGNNSNRTTITRWISSTTSSLRKILIVIGSNNKQIGALLNRLVVTAESSHIPEGHEYKIYAGLFTTTKLTTAIAHLTNG